MRSQMFSVVHLTIIVLVLISIQLCESTQESCKDCKNGNNTLVCAYNNNTCCPGYNGGVCDCCGSSQVCLSVPNGNTSSGLCCASDEEWCIQPDSVFELDTNTNPFCCNPQKAIKKGVGVGLIVGALNLGVFILIIGAVLRRRKTFPNKTLFTAAVVGGLISIIGECLLWMGAFGSPFGVHVLTVGILIIFEFTLRTLFVHIIVDIRRGQIPFMFWPCFGCMFFVAVIVLSIFIIFVSALNSWNPHCITIPDTTITNMPVLKSRTCYSFKYVSIGLLLIFLALVS